MTSAHEDLHEGLKERGWLAPNANLAKSDVATTPAQARATPQSLFAIHVSVCEITVLRNYDITSVVISKVLQASEARGGVERTALAGVQGREPHIPIS